MIPISLWYLRLELDAPPQRPQKAYAKPCDPGSVSAGRHYKIVMAVAGLEEGLITPKRRSTVVVYSLWQSRVQGLAKRWARTCQCPLGVSPIVRCLFYTLGHRLGIDTIARYAKGFGLGMPSGYDPVHEKPGLVPSTAWKRQARGEPWYPGRPSRRHRPGYNLVTPMQLLNVISAVANGGVRYRPRIVKRLETPMGKWFRSLSRNG